MTTKQLQDKINELEKRIALLESQRPIINVYPTVQSPSYQQGTASPITPTPPHYFSY